MEDRVRRNTSATTNIEIDEAMKERIRFYAARSRQEISARIEELEKEWDIERLLAVNMSSLSLSGLALGFFVNKRWLLLPAIVLGFYVQHSLQGWCPPLPVFRKMGVRTRPEIEQEKYALKMLRGDFDNVALSDNKDRSTEQLVSAVKA